MDLSKAALNYRPITRSLFHKREKRVRRRELIIARGNCQCFPLIDEWRWPCRLPISRLATGLAFSIFNEREYSRPTAVLLGTHTRPTVSVGT